MKTYIVLGTIGGGVWDIKDALKPLLGKGIELQTTDRKNSSSTKLEFEAATPKGAKKLIEKAFRWLTHQRWYHDNSKLSLTTSGLSDGEADWTCDFCGGTLDQSQCKTMKGAPRSL